MEFGSIVNQNKLRNRQNSEINNLGKHSNNICDTKLKSFNFVAKNVFWGHFTPG